MHARSARENEGDASRGDAVHMHLVPSQASIERVIRRHQAGLWRYLRALGCSPDLADDLTQEAFLVAFRRGLQDTGPHTTGSFLRKTARHLFLRSRRTSRRREAILVEAADLLWTQDCASDDGDEWLEALRACMDSVEGRGREALTLFYRDGASRAEAARALDMKENGVKTLLARVRQALRDCVRRRMA